MKCKTNPLGYSTRAAVLPDTAHLFHRNWNLHFSIFTKIPKPTYYIFFYCSASVCFTTIIFKFFHDNLFLLFILFFFCFFLIRSARSLSLPAFFLVVIIFSTLKARPRPRHRRAGPLQQATVFFVDYPSAWLDDSTKKPTHLNGFQAPFTM